MRNKLRKYMTSWKRRGYKNGIPDIVPDVLMDLKLAPSYKAMCIAILKNDHSMKSLGLTPRKSEYYNALKKIEIDNRIKEKV